MEREKDDRADSTLHDRIPAHSSIESTHELPKLENLTKSENPDLQLAAYDYHLPEERIAQNPVVPRDSSRLLVVDARPNYRHCVFRDLPDLLQPGDLLVLNNTRVIPARLYGHKVDGHKVEDRTLAPDTARRQVEVLLLEEQEPNEWLALVKPGKRLKPGATIEFGQIKLGNHTSPDRHADSASGANSGSDQFHLTAQIMAIDPPTGGRVLRFNLPTGQSLIPLLAQLGVVPLPPYITASQAAPEQYQTVYAESPGSAAAPTAGLHFTPELLNRLSDRGIQQVFVTLHVGVGTFRPVEVEDITQHQMHGEWGEIPVEVVEKIEQTKANGGRIIAVGTTAVRALEGAAQGGSLQPYCGKTELFIYPGYQWRVIDGMITNFHLPKSSLMMLVSALIGRQRLLDLYQVAIDQQYRFYSFGDAMLVLPEAREKK
jgi:S-adenosylmethionine:tRNA ribosyltransferase-isomerase